MCRLFGAIVGVLWSLNIGIYQMLDGAAILGKDAYCTAGGSSATKLFFSQVREYSVFHVCMGPDISTIQ